MGANPKRKVGNINRWLSFVVLLAILSTGLFGCRNSRFILTVSVTPNTGGTVSPGSGVYDKGEQVTLTAIATENYRFSGWSGNSLSGVGNSITITMNSNKAVVASFVKITYELQINQNIADGGEIEPKSGSYEAGTHVSIRAIPASGYRFDGWTGSISGTSNSLNVLMDSTKNLTANFIKSWNLSANCNPEGAGSVSPGSGTYDDGTKLELTAVANFPYAFDHWGENNGDKANPTDITLNSDTSIIAYFAKLSSDTQQIKTGVYDGSEILIHIQVILGQWVKVEISSNPNDIPIRILDPNSDIVNDFGLTNEFTNNFQAQTTGTYTIDIEGSSSTSPAVYEVGYSLYSLPSAVVITPIPTTTPTTTPATIIIAALDSSNQWKSEAIAVCSGTSAQSVINTYLIPDITVELAPGTFNISKNISLDNNTHLYGQGNTTVINLEGAGISATNVNNVEIDHIELTGVVNRSIINSAIWIGASSTSVTGINIHDITCNSLGSDHFNVESKSSHEVSYVVFSNITSIDPDGFGFVLLGNGNEANLITNVTFYNCDVTNAGVSATRTGNYVTGFDLAEYSTNPSRLTVANIYVIKCSVYGAWESDFHLEGTPAEQNVVLTGCNASDAGQKPTPTYGYGYLINGDTVVCNNTASSNTNGALYINGEAYTNVLDTISPSDSIKVAIAVNQGKCSGVMISVDATHKELVLYSNDGNPVRQPIELGNYYEEDDDRTYSFSGTKIIVQFTNYAVIKLVNLGTLPNS